MQPFTDVFSEETIAAIATPAGRGAVAVVRISGPDAGELAARICPALRVARPLEPRTARLLAVADPVTGEVVDHALVTWFPGPGSFTGEDTVELSTHGGALAPRLVLAAAISAGARQALPGEFTRRALLNGKLDLLQAEAILDLVNGSSPALHRAAIHQLERGLSARVSDLRHSLLQAEALLSYGIDFPDEDEPPVPPARIIEAVEEVQRRIERMLRTAPQGELLREGALVVLAGRPNAGKSSLFNALLGFERSIVTELPGTTRDAIEAQITIRGYPFRLVDTAGLRETADRVEGLGVEVAERYLLGADIVLYCAEAGAPMTATDDEFLARRPSDGVIVVRTKGDVAAGPVPDKEGGVPRCFVVSAYDGSGLSELGDAIVELAFGLVSDEGGEEPLLTRRRHVSGLERASVELDAFLRDYGGGVPAEFVATHLRNAALAMEEIIGAVSTDDVLGAIFSEFCVGK